jgi:hypothetical protein
MADAPKSDTDCIEAAYEDAVGGLYKQFFANLAGQPDNEKELLAHFANGLQLAKKAKALALGVVQPPPPTAAIAEKAAQKRQRKPVTG